MAGFNPVYAGVGDNKRDVYGATEVAIFTIAFASGDTYTTGGLALTAAIFGLSRPILSVEVIGCNTAAIVWQWMWNVQTQKLMMLGTSGNTVGLAPNADATGSPSLTGFIVTVIVTTQR